jgi:hypothetical protein
MEIEQQRKEISTHNTAVMATAMATVAQEVDTQTPRHALIGNQPS